MPEDQLLKNLPAGQSRASGGEAAASAPLALRFIPHTIA